MALPEKSDQGITLIELLVVVAIIGILAALSAPFISFGINPLQDTSDRLAGNFKLMRAKAMSQTSAYRIRPNSATQLVVERARTCTDTTGWNRDPSFTDEDLSLKEAGDVKGLAKNADIQITNATVNGTAVTPLTNWMLCYNSRGIADNNLILTIEDQDTNQQRQIEVFAGGGVQVYE